MGSADDLLFEFPRPQPECVVAMHEAGHAVARFLVHGDTGEVLLEPGRQGRSQSKPLPPCIHEARLQNEPFTPCERARLEAEIKTALAGAITEAWARQIPPREVLMEAEQHLDRDSIQLCATDLWGSKDLWLGAASQDMEARARVNGLLEAIGHELLAHRNCVERVAAKLERQRGLTALEVRQLLQ